MPGQVRFPDILRRQRNHAGHLGRSHRRTGHIFIGRAARDLAIDRINISAGGSDLRFQGQAARNAPRTEAAHGIVFQAKVPGSNLLAHRKRTGIVQNLPAAAGHWSSVGLEHLAVCLGHGDKRRRFAVIGEIHIDGACLIVINNRGDCTGGDGIVPFFEEGNVAASGAHQYLPLYCITQCRKFLRLPISVYVDIRLLPGQGGHGGVAVFRLGIEHQIAANIQVHPRVSAVVYGSHRQGIGIRTRHTGGGHTHITGIQVTGRAVAILHPGAGVAGRHGGHNAAVRQRIQNGLIRIIAVPVIARAAGTQGQIYRITAQHNRILNGSHIVRIVCTAGSAKYLHGNNLGIRRNALDIDRLQGRSKTAVRLGNIGICRCNSRHMGAVFCLAVVVMGNVQIPIDVVKSEGELPAEVQILRRIVLCGNRAGNV